jgi:WD repeat-containing protein 22
MYAGGSDDFRGYVWRVPPISQLAAVRNEVSAAEWETRGMGSSVGMSSQSLNHLGGH